jgi:hypothetical protein
MRNKKLKKEKENGGEVVFKEITEKFPELVKDMDFSDNHRLTPMHTV